MNKTKKRGEKMKEIIVNNDMKISQVVAGCMRVADANLTGHQFLTFVEECMEM